MRASESDTWLAKMTLCILVKNLWFANLLTQAYNHFSLSLSHTCVLTCESILNCLSLPPHVLVKYIFYDINTVHIVSSCKMTLFDFWIFSQTSLFGNIVKLLMLKLPTCVSNAILSTLYSLTNCTHLPCRLHSILYNLFLTTIFITTITVLYFWSNLFIS